MARKKTAYAKVSWNAEDVLEKAKELKIKMTTAEAEDFLYNNQRRIQDRMIEVGWDALEACLRMESK